MPEPEATGPIVSELVAEDPSFADMVSDFVDGLPERLRQLQEMIEASDFDGLQSLGHQLKGAGGGYGYPVLTQLGSQIEREAIAAALDDCTRTLDELKATVARLAVAPD